MLSAPSKLSAWVISNRHSRCSSVRLVAVIFGVAHCAAPPALRAKDVVGDGLFVSESTYY